MHWPERRMCENLWIVKITVNHLTLSSKFKENLIVAKPVVYEIRCESSKEIRDVWIANFDIFATPNKITSGTKPIHLQLKLIFRT